MAIHTRKELCDSLQIKQGTISMAVKRGHLLLTKDGKVDDSIPENNLFINKYKAKRGMAGEEPEQPQPAAPEPEQTTNQQIGGANTLTRLKVIKEQVGIKKANEEYELIKLKKEKLQKETISIDVIKALIVNVSESAKIAWKDASEAMVLRVSKQARLTRAQEGEIKAGIVAIVNAAVDKTHALTLKSLKRMQADFAQKRGKGERG